MNGRHVKSTIIMTIQYQIGIQPSLRNNIDFVFICKETKLVEKQKLHKYFAGVFPTYDMFNQIFTQCTSDYGCMVIDNTSQREELEEQVFWYKAEIHPEFKICLQEFWYNNDDYMKNDEMEEKMNANANNNANSKNDEYYKYAGTRSKTKFNMKVEKSQQKYYVYL